MQTEPTMERLRARKEAKLRQKLAVLICGPTGTGKTFVSCALGEQTCRQGHRVLYMRVPRLLEALALAHADGTDCVASPKPGLLKAPEIVRRALLQSIVAPAKAERIGCGNRELKRWKREATDDLLPRRSARFWRKPGSLG